MTAPVIPLQAPAAGDRAPFGCLENVRKVFGAAGSAAPVVAIDSVSCTMGKGELVSLLGPSGCGKTTLLRIVAGLSSASSGTVRVRGHDVTGPQRDFGFVFQSPNLMPWRTVLDNVLFPMEILHKRTGAARRRAEELLDLVGLGGFGRARPHQLSGGMQQRVALCRALIHEPALLLMDEPFGALDELTRMDMHDLLLNIRRVTQATVMFVTHSISEAIYLSDQVLVFSKRPARIVDHIHIGLAYPRRAAMRYDDAFTRLEERASTALGILNKGES
jgi:NitT/TauT family transport system ATP-binding protein